MMIIDQDAAGTATFAQNMGLLMPKADDGTALEKLPAGTYTVKVGGDKVAAIAVKTFTVSDSTDDPDLIKELKFVYGDVNGDSDFDTIDASAVLNAYVGVGAMKPGKSEYELGTKFVDKDNNEVYVWGDVNGDSAFDTIDASAILNAYVGVGAMKPGKSDYTLGETVTLNNVKIKAN